MGLLKIFSGQSPEKIEEKGDAFFNNRSWGMAKIEYEKAWTKLEKMSPGNDESKARLQEKLGQAKEALAFEHKQSGEDLMELGDYDDACEIFQLAIELTQDQELISAIKDRMLEMERLTQGSMQPDLPDPQLGDEIVPDEPGDEYFEVLCGVLPKDVQAAYLSYGESFKSGYLALNRAEFDLAAEYLSRAMKENPVPDSFIPLELATACLNLKRYDEARELVETFLQYHPDVLPGYQLLCEVLWKLNAFDRAEALLAGCPDELRHSMACYHLRGETMFQAGNYADAASFFQDVLEEYGWNESMARSLAATYEALEDFERARLIYAEIMSHCRSCHSFIDPYIKRKFADISFDLGKDLSVILDLYLTMAHEDPANSPFYYERASRIFSLMGDEEEASRFQLIAQRAQQESV